MRKILGVTLCIFLGLVVFLGVLPVTVPNVWAEDVTIDLNLPSGWSMFSLPVLPPNPVLSELFPEARVVYGYEKGIGYVRVREEEELKFGKGYWILFDDEQSYSLSGQSIQEYPLSFNEGGWGMIGGCSYSAQASADNANIHVIYGFDQESGYKRVLDSEKLMPGNGYWISLSDSAMLRVDSGWPPGDETESVEIMPGSGVHTKLSPYNNEVSINCYEWTDSTIFPHQVRVFYWKDDVYQGPFDLPEDAFDLTVDDENDHVFGTITLPDGIMTAFGIKGTNDYIKVRLTLSNLVTKHSGAVHVDTLVDSGEVDSYLAVLPQTLNIGEEGAVSMSLFTGEYLARAKVLVALSKDGESILETEQYINGKGSIGFAVPQIEPGEYALGIKSESFEDSATVKVEETILVFVETDKPIYKPGQTMHLRVSTLNTELKPINKSAVVEVQDAKGIKIFKTTVDTDEYGMATFDLPISKEPNLGVWKILAVVSEEGNAQLDVRVEEYVLPKYEVKADLPKEWFLVDEPITGKIEAEYSFGKPVKGELVIEASRYVGEWEVYETFSAQIDGEKEFAISPVGYVAGTPAAGGMGNVTLDISVRETNTGYEEQTNKLLTVSDAPLNIQIIPESSVFKPSLPLNVLIITETPDNKPRDTSVDLTITYLDKDFEEIEKPEQTKETIETIGGKGLLTLIPPAEAIAMVIDAEAEGATASKALASGYSPSGNFIHVEQVSQGIPKVGEKITFKVHSTSEAVNFYYEVISRGRVIFTSFTGSTEISFTVIPLMAPSSKLLVYQILPTSEVAADYMPFSVEADYPHTVKATFSKEEAKPGEELEITIKTEGKAKVGLAVVDKSVFILAEKRLNLQQVFDELERLYMEPQAELHSYSVYQEVDTKGAEDTFKAAKVTVLSNKKLPKGEKHTSGFWWGGGQWEKWQRDPVFWAFMFANGMLDMDAALIPQAGAMPPETGELAEVERVRQFFPETWKWEALITDEGGNASLPVEVPDTITTWMLHAVGVSKEKGLGIGEDELRAFQPFFIKIDLPYSAIRGEEFPVMVSVYNYLDKTQSVVVEIEPDGWFELLDDTSKVIDVGANDIGGAQFKIRPKQIGTQEIKVTARSEDVADAVIKTMIIEPEGVRREQVTNLILNPGASKVINTSIPGNVVEGSERAYVAATSSYLTQTIEGLEELLKMPSGCGEQNMIFLAPDTYITRYLKQSGQLKPEIMAKAEKLMITGYQRELTYRRSDGSFSAFGQSDNEGSLWLTAFVLKVFSQAKGLMYIDDMVLEQAKAWITGHQNEDGSFDAVGFVHHSEMIGGLQGKTALTAFVTIALLEAGEETGSARAAQYLEGRLEEINDPYTIAMVAYALELAGSPLKDMAYEKLLELSEADENGLYWPASGAEIEATGYGAMALLAHGDKFNAGRAARWLVSKRNAYGGYGSTQDTVVALDALTKYSIGVASDVNLTVEIRSGTSDDAGTEFKKEILINSENFDVLQVVEVPTDKQIEISAEGTGEAVIQNVLRFNLPEVQEPGQIFNISVEYDTAHVEVNDILNISVVVEFTPPIPIEAGMVVLDISVPTGFTAVTESLEEVLNSVESIKRYEVAMRKIIFYIENMLPGDKIAFSFDAKAMYPVKAKGVSSQAYSYYKPEMKGETLSGEIVVSEDN